MNRWKLDPTADKREATEPLRVSLAELMAKATAAKSAENKAKD